MPEITRPQLVLYAVAVCLVVWLGARYLGSGSGAAGVPVVAGERGGAGAGGGRSGLEVRREGGGRVTVHVAGEVRRPGVYRLRDGARVESAVRSAGGATRRADLDGLNLAGEVEDGRQVVVPRRGAAGAGGAAAGGAGSPVAGGAPGQPIDLNLATLEQLDTLDGVGPATAQKILDFREEQGGFGSVEELGQVPGIGEKRMAALREKVRV